MNSERLILKKGIISVCNIKLNKIGAFITTYYSISKIDRIELFS